MNRVFNACVAVPVLQHPKSVPGKNVYFGIDWETIRTNVIELGRGDFTKGYKEEGVGELSAEQVCLCYCFANLKKHFFSAYGDFLENTKLLTDSFKKAKKVVVIDVGCGPGTGGLAFSECFSQPVSYFGIDRAFMMRNQARKMMKLGIAEGLVHKATKAICESSWDAVPTEFGANTVVVVIYSYFFASPYLNAVDIKALARFYKKLVRAAGNVKVFTAFTNSRAPVANKNYDTYLKALGVDPKESPPRKTTVHFYMNASNGKKGDETYVGEIYGAIG